MRGCHNQQARGSFHAAFDPQLIQQWSWGIPRAILDALAMALAAMDTTVSRAAKSAGLLTMSRQGGRGVSKQHTCRIFCKLCRATRVCTGSAVAFSAASASCTRASRRCTSPPSLHSAAVPDCAGLCMLAANLSGCLVWSASASAAAAAVSFSGTMPAGAAAADTAAGGVRPGSASRAALQGIPQSIASAELAAPQLPDGCCTAESLVL